MGFRYLDRLASPEQIHGFLELMDLAAGGGESAQNVFELSHRLRKSSPMQLCRKRLARDPEAQRLIQARQLSGPTRRPTPLAASAKGWRWGPTPSPSSRCPGSS